MGLPSHSRMAYLRLVRSMKTSHAKLHVAALTLLLVGCATVPPVEDTIHVSRPFPEVVARVAEGMQTEIKHPITFTRDAVRYRRDDITPGVVRFEVWTWAPDYGDQKPFADVDVIKASGATTDIRIRERSAGSGQKTYLTGKIRSWFPSAR